MVSTKRYARLYASVVHVQDPAGVCSKDNRDSLRGDIENTSFLYLTDGSEKTFSIGQPNDLCGRANIRRLWTHLEASAMHSIPPQPSPKGGEEVVRAAYAVWQSLPKRVSAIDLDDDLNAFGHASAFRNCAMSTGFRHKPPRTSIALPPFFDRRLRYPQTHNVRRGNPCSSQRRGHTRANVGTSKS